MFTNGPGDRALSYTKESKIVLHTSLLNIQRHKVRIKGKVGQLRDTISVTPSHLGFVSIEKEAFRSPLTTLTTFTY